MLDSTNENSPKLKPENNEVVIEFDEEAQLKIEIIQTLLEPCDRAAYGKRLKEAAEKLGKSKRTVQRLVKKWEEEGLAALTQTKRADKGSHRIDELLKKFILKTYQDGNKGSKRITPKQVYLRTKIKANELGVKTPSHMTVYRVLKPLIDKKKQAKSIRSPGWRGTQLSVKTRAGQDLSVEYSNNVWQCDHTRADVLLVDKYGELLGRPWLTTVIDTYSRCIMGINLGFDAPSSQVVALALRHAILPKNYGMEYGLHEEWGTYGLPQHFYTDGGKDFRSNHLNQIGVQLGFVCHLRDRPSEGGIVERPFKTFNTELFSTLPGYTGSNVQERPEDAEKQACLTLRDLEKRFVRYIVDNYNQRLDARMGEQTRFQRWESGLIATPDVLSVRDLDICLMKQTRRRIQRGGYIQFENLMYRGEYLAGYAGETVILRYEPRDITEVLVYRQEDNKEVFLARAFAQDLETENIALDEAKSSSRKVREAGKTISNRSILNEIRAPRSGSLRDRDLFTPPDKKTRKERQKEEQTQLSKQKKTIQTQAFMEEEIKPWWFMIEPLAGESISHYLGRFRRENELSATQLGKISGLGAIIGRWEKFRFNPPPSREQLEALATVVGIDVDRLAQTLPPFEGKPPKGVGMKLIPIRLCAACYIQNPCHQMQWQFKQTDRCYVHQLRLLSECPNCKARFQIPALWVDGWCSRCFLPFAEMVNYQKSSND